MNKDKNIQNTTEQAVNYTACCASVFYFHPYAGEGGRGKLIKQFYRTGFGETIIIELPSGRQYFAPAGEFQRVP